MKRKAPVLEVRFSPHPHFEGWMKCLVTIRNLEPVSVDLIELAPTRRRMQILRDTDARHAEQEPRNGSGDYLPLEELPTVHSVTINKRLLPAGERLTVLRKTRPVDITTISLQTKGMTSARDFRLDWAWADGQPR